MKTKKWIKVDESHVPPTTVFLVESHRQGQIVEVAEDEAGRYQRRHDRSDRSVAYYRRLD